MRSHFTVWQHKYDLFNVRYCGARSDSCWVEGPYKKRQGLMRELCKKAGVEHFGFHALSHAGASLLDSISTVAIGDIQRILGHENRITTELYLQGIGGKERDAMVAYEKARKEKSHTESHPNAA